MHYIVNKQTKEHRVLEVGYLFKTCHIIGEEFRIVEADENGWIEWLGGECPLPNDERCEVELAAGSVMGIRHPQRITRAWDRTAMRPNQVIAYRPACYHEQQEEEPEWDGEGLPPVGTNCEILAWSEWKKVEVTAIGEKLVLVKYMESIGQPEGHALKSTRFRPIRTTAQRAEEAIASVLPEAHTREGKASALYNAIREGRIPGVTLEDR